MRTAVLPVLAAALLVAACTSDPAAPAPVDFNGEGDVQLTCMSHQTDPPGPDYTDRERVNLTRDLQVFQYYVRNGALGYCDGAGPSDVDRAWAQFYADGTKNRVPVAAILDAPTG